MRVKKFVSILMSLTLLAALPACDRADDDSSTKVNGSVRVAAGKPAESASSVNGSIRIDENGAVTKADTVNGSINLGAHATAQTLETVNGGITLEAGAHVAGEVTTVNGSLILREGAEIAGPLSNVNGKIELKSAHVAGGITTVDGSIDIAGDSHVEGGILVRKGGTSVISLSSGVPRIVIGPGATVDGELRFERKVDLYVSDRAKIGAVTGATAVAFTGDTPPAR